MYLENVEWNRIGYRTKFFFFMFSKIFPRCDIHILRIYYELIMEYYNLFR